MKKWLKFYFLGFFNDKYGKEAANRSFFNVLLGLLLTVILIAGGISAGYAASFGKHYNDAEVFRDFLYSAFVSSDGSGIELKMQDGKLCAEIPDKERVNGFLEEEYSFNGYKLIVDTNPAETVFDDFKLVCKDANGVELSYEDYLKLPETGKKNGSVVFEYSGKPLDVTLKQADYIAYLDKLSDEADSQYDGDAAKAYGELKHKRNSGEITEEQYAVEIYTLYAKNYYPSYSRIESYGAAPTLRTYYTQAELIQNEDKYLILLDDTFICSFTTANGITVNFAGYYMGVSDGVVSAKGMSTQDARANIDKFVKQCFAGSGGLIFFVYIVNIFNVFLLLIAIILILALIVFACSRLLRLEFGRNYFGAVKTVGSYLFYSALIAFVSAFILSFFYARGTVFPVIEIVFVCVLALRTVIRIVTEIVRKNKSGAIESGEKTATEEITE